MHVAGGLLPMGLRCCQKAEEKMKTQRVPKVEILNWNFGADMKVDIALTLSNYLRIKAPSGATGAPLVEVLNREP
jgi:hypothetical protein